jgi:hypothetical protein
MKIYSSKHQAIVEAPIFQEPNILSDKYDLGFAFDIRAIDKDTEAYNKWLSTHIAVLPEHQHLFRDGQEVKEGVDYEIRTCKCKIGEDCTREKGKWFTTCLVAKPIKKQLTEEEKEPSPQQGGQERNQWKAVFNEKLKALRKESGKWQFDAHAYLDGFTDGGDFAREWWQSQLSQALATIKELKEEIEGFKNGLAHRALVTKNRTLEAEIAYLREQLK